MTMRLRDGCAAKIGARGHDAAPAETAAPASLRNWRRSREAPECLSFFDITAPLAHSDFCARNHLSDGPGRVNPRAALACSDSLTTRRGCGKMSGFEASARHP